MIVKSMCEIYERSGIYMPLFYAQKVSPEYYPAFEKFDMKQNQLKNRYIILGMNFIEEQILVGFCGVPTLYPDKEMIRNLIHHLNRKVANPKQPTGIL